MYKEICYSVSRFPGWGYTAGGAERHIQLLSENISIPGQVVVFNDRDNGAEANGCKVPRIIGSSQQELLLQIYRQYFAQPCIHYIASHKFTRDPVFAEQLFGVLNGPKILRMTSQKIVEEISHATEAWQKQLSQIDFFISQAPELTAQVIATLNLLGIDAGRVHEITNGVDTEEFCPVTPEEKVQLRTTILGKKFESALIYTYCGRIGNTLKHVDVTIRAFLNANIDANAVLVLVGDYESEFGRALYKKYASNERVIFLGTQTSETVSKVLKLSDVFINASSNEGFSNAMLEAQASGLPVIARDGVSGNSNMITHGETGLFFKEEADLVALMEAMIDPDQRQRIGKNARQHVKDNYSVEQMIRQYVAFFSRL